MFIDVTKNKNSKFYNKPKDATVTAILGRIQLDYLYQQGKMDAQLMMMM